MFKVSIAKSVLIISVIFLSSCSTMHFVNGPEFEETVIRESWHHSALNGLVEVSPPLDLNYVCDDKQWDTVTIEQTFLNSLTTITSTYFSVYSPWTIFYECRENID